MSPGAKHVGDGPDAEDKEELEWAYKQLMDEFYVLDAISQMNESEYTFPAEKVEQGLMTLKTSKQMTIQGSETMPKSILGIHRSSAPEESNTPSLHTSGVSLLCRACIRSFTPLHSMHQELHSFA